jgi:hypothetical protein
MTIFSAAIDAMFGDPNMSVAAEWRAGGIGAPVSVRVIRTRPDVELGFADSRISTPSENIDVRVSQVAAARQGDTVAIDGDVFTITGAPQRDTERLVWRCEAAKS